MSLMTSLLAGRSGLRSANAGINATSNNVSNVSTPGYHRRTVEQATRDPFQNGRLNYGVGSQVMEIGRSNDRIINMRRLQEAGEANASETEFLHLTSIERLFDEDQDSTVRGELEAFFDGLVAATADPADLGLRQQVSHNGERLAIALNRSSSTIEKQALGFAENAESSLVVINSQLAEIADLNAQINGAGGAMGTGDLTDRRDMIIRNLSEKIGVTADLHADGQATVFMGGHALVSKSESRKLSLDPTVSPLSLFVNAGGGTIDVTDDASGELGGYVAAHRKAEDYLGQLNTFAEDFATAMNAQHAAGFDRTGTGGGDLFTFTPADAAGTITFSSAISADSDLLAFAGAATGLAGDVDNLSQLIAQEENNIIAGTSTPRSFLSRLTTQIGNDVADSERLARTKHAVLDDLDELYTSLHGVDMDEEASKLVMYQSAYQASAKVISVTNDLMNNLLNLV